MRRRPPMRLVSTLLAFACVGSFSTLSIAGWGPNPVTVRPTTASIPLVVGANDGGYGTFAVWQEEATAGSGLLKVQHLLPTGDLDPAWPVDGALACDVAAARIHLGAIPDRIGGVYVWWSEPNAAGPRLHLNRLDATGAVAAGWPARGRFLGTVSLQSQTPRVISDGVNGIYLAWTADGFSGDPTNVRVIRLGPSNTGAGGWPNSARILDVDAVPAIDLWPQIALAPDGGVFVAWGSWSQDEGALASSYRLRRLTGAGLNAGGWPLEGFSLGPFHPDLLGSDKGASLLAISDDGRGGLWALVGDGTGEGSPASLATSLYRLQGDGQTAVDWPASGRVPPNAPCCYLLTTAPASFRLHSDGIDGALTGMPEICADCLPPIGFMRASASGTWSGSEGGPANRLEDLPRGDGGLYLASCQPTGPTGPFQPPAFIALSQTSASGFTEYHNEPVLTWFGDVGLASSGAGGAVFFWSQSRERFGLFARRFSAAGEVTGVEAGAILGLKLRGLRFLRGRGVVASLDLDGRGAKLELFDVAGRRLASRDLTGAGSVEVTVPGTASLSSGLYLARLTNEAEKRFGKVVVSQ